MENTTDVIFRKWNNGQVIALFPAVPFTQSFGHCSSYEHIGQHGAASVDLTDITRPATEQEYTPLKKELESLGYVLRVVKRRTAKHDRERRAALQD